MTQNSGERGGGMKFGGMGDNNVEVNLIKISCMKFYNNTNIGFNKSGSFQKVYKIY